MERKSSCHVANLFMSRLELIWPYIQPENLQNVQKIGFWQKKKALGDIAFIFQTV